MAGVQTRASADGNLDKQVEQMRSFSETEQQRHQEYLKQNDFANGVSQRTGPTGDPTKDGGGVGWRWSMK